MMETKLSKIHIELFIITWLEFQENSGKCHVITNFVGIHKKGIQSIS